MLDLVFEYIFASLSLIWMGKLDMYFYERFLGTCNASGCLVLWNLVCRMFVPRLVSLTNSIVAQASNYLST